MLTGAALVVVMWMLAPVASDLTPLRTPVASSEAIRALNAIVVPVGPTRDGELPPIDNLPRFQGSGPDIAPGDPAILSDPAVRAAQRSVVRIEVDSCEGRSMGTGWVGADGIVVTNAHVVAGSRMITAQPRGRRQSFPAVPIWFDGEQDIALLRVPGLRGLPVLPMVQEPRAGTAGASMGFPRGRWRVRHVRVGPTSDRIGGRLGGRASPGVSNAIGGRLVTTIRGRLQPGNSGGPVIDDRGRVLTTALAAGFASSSLGVPNRFVRAGLRRAKAPVSTGRCR